LRLLYEGEASVLKRGRPKGGGSEPPLRSSEATMW